MPVKRENTPSSDISPTSKKAKPSPEKKEKRVWTAAEEVTFLEIIEKLCATQLWAEVKKDGRLEERGQPGIRAHYLALFKNLKKGAGRSD